MFKFIKQYAETIQGAQVYPLFSLFVFLVFFIVLLWYVVKMDKSSVNHLSQIPFDANQTENESSSSR